MPTLFEREYENHRVIGIKPNVTEGMERVLDDEGMATSKIKKDGGKKMFFKFLANDIKLNACPFCGETNLEVGVSDNPFVVWDGAVRGERAAYVVCECGAMIKQQADVYVNYIFDDKEDIEDLKKELIDCAKQIADKWNKRTQENYIEGR